ncbi:MAG: metallophosphoesterase family protein, partial [Dethiobacteria bacterium]
MSKFNYLFWLRLFISSIVGMVIFVSLFSAHRFIFGAVEIELALKIFDHGLTEVVIPPVGRVRAQTHLPPFMFQATLLNVNFDLLSQMVEDIGSEGQEVKWLIEQGRSYIYFFVIRNLVLAFLGGAAGVFFYQRRVTKDMLWGGLIGLLIFSLALLLAGVTYEIDAFANPEFEGLLSAAPWLLGLVEEAIIAVQNLGVQLQVIAENLLVLFERLETLDPLGVIDGELKVLHVSDIHNNPAAIDFIGQIIRTFDVDLVIDTGDIIDYGTPLEAELASRVANLSVLYVIVPGNHDSPQVIDYLQEAGVNVLLEGVIEVKGLHIAGIRDPSSKSTSMKVESEEVYKIYAERLKEIIIDAEEPDLLAVHHPLMAQAFRGDIPVLLMGHTHKNKVEVGKDFIAINAGTSGAAGVRGLQTETELPYSVVLIYFNFNEQGRPIATAADFITVFRFQSSFVLERHLLNQPQSKEDN